jgi:hypothetical protein
MDYKELKTLLVYTSIYFDSYFIALHPFIEGLFIY